MEIEFKSFLEIFEFAKLMSLRRKAIPHQLRNRPDRCLLVVMHAAGLRINPFYLANMTYFVRNGRRPSKMGISSQNNTNTTKNCHAMHMP